MVTPIVLHAFACAVNLVRFVSRNPQHMGGF